MTDRESRDRLVELIANKCQGEARLIEGMADHLIANGVSIDRHGEWKIQRHLLSRCKTIYCSECNFSMERGPAWEIDWGLPSYCSQCGAKMEIKGNDNE